MEDMNLVVVVAVHYCNKGADTCSILPVIRYNPPTLPVTHTIQTQQNRRLEQSVTDQIILSSGLRGLGAFGPYPTMLTPNHKQQ